METLGAKLTLSNGLVVELQRDIENNLVVKVTGQGLPEPVLLPGTMLDMIKVSKLLNIGIQLAQTV
jgi:hypothetical protein